MRVSKFKLSEAILVIDNEKKVTPFAAILNKYTSTTGRLSSFKRS